MTAMVSPAQYDRTALPRPALYIGDERIYETKTGFAEKFNPADGTLLSEFPIAGQHEVDAAVAAAWNAFPGWKRLGADERRQMLWRLADTIKLHEDELKLIHSAETGAPIATISYEMAIDHLQYYAGWCDKLEGELISTYPKRALDYVKYEPYGVVGAIVTWNSPLINACMKLAPALAAGNCVVLKSSELGPFALMRMIELFSEAGLPSGVVNVLSGDKDTTRAIVDHPGVRKISFTGGPAVASAISELAARTLTPATLELGGKSANIIYADADLEQASQMASFMSTIAGAGQGCLFPTRLLVQDTVYDEVVGRVTAISESISPGNPLDPSVIMGPVISEDAVTRILAMIGRAKSSSARLVTGGNRLAGDLAGGYFVAPTVFADVDGATELAQSEVFGPVLAIEKFSTEAESVSKANATKYGLAAYVNTTNLARAHRIADELDAGWIGVNCFPTMQASAPFGGTKQSGYGREGGRAGIEEYVYHKNVFVSLD